MKRKLLALLLTGSFLAAGSAHAAAYNSTHFRDGYSFSQIGSSPAWNNPPDMDPNFIAPIVTVGRIFGTWVAKNHKTVWQAILGVFSYVGDLGDGTLTGNPPEFYDVDEEEACRAHHDFNHADEADQNSGLDEGYDDEYDLTEEEMSQLDWFCGNYTAP